MAIKLRQNGLIPNTQRLDCNIISISDEFPRNHQLAIKRDFDHHESCRAGIDLDRSCVVAQPKPTPRYGAFLDHDPAKDDRSYVNFPKRVDRLSFTVRSLAEDECLMFVTPNAQQQDTNNKSGESHLPSKLQGTGPIPGAPGGEHC